MNKKNLSKCYLAGTLSFVFVMMSIAATVLQSRYAGQIIDVLPLKDYERLFHTFLIFILCLAVSVLALQISRSIFNVLVERVCMLIGEELLLRTLMAKLNDVIGKTKEEILQVVYNDIEYIRKAGSSSILQFVIDLSAAVASLVMMACLYPPFCLVCIAVYPLNMIAVKTNGLKQKEKEGLLREVNIEGERLISKTLLSIRDIKLMGKEKEILDEYKRLQEQWAVTTQKKYIILNIFKNIPRVLDAVVPAIVFLVGFFAIERGDITLGTIVTTVSLASNVNKPIRSFSEFYISFKNLNLIKDDMQYYLKLADEYGKKEGTAVETIRSIEFVNVSVVKEGKYILKGVSFKICSGEKIAVVGPSGAGKSTILRVLLKLEECSEGRIIINGIYNLQDIDTRKWRHAIGALLQKNTLFNESIEYNLDIYHSWNEDGGKSLLKILHLEKFSDQMDMVVGSSVQKISGGERQRLCIAQMLTKNNEALILDEPTSALDENSETSVMEYLFREMYGDKIILYTTHRLRTLAYADKVLFVYEGRIHDFAGHQELMLKNDQYKYFIQAEDTKNEIKK